MGQYCIYKFKVITFSKLLRYSKIMLVKNKAYFTWADSLDLSRSRWAKSCDTDALPVLVPVLPATLPGLRFFLAVPASVKQKNQIIRTYRFPVE